VDGLPKYCDMVMKGGITSGVVYPTAVCELAGQYQFKNIGGASAGAIAAAAAAAAEYGRQNSVKDSFEQLGKLPDEFGQPDFLPGLFTPNGNTRPIFNAVIRFLKARSRIGKILAALFCVLGNFLGSAIIGGLIGLALALPGISLVQSGTRSFWQTAGIAFASSLLILLGAVIAATARALSHATTAVVKNGFGLSNGLSTKGPGQAPLTNWMYSLFNRLAGLPEGRPLVFGHLWAGREVGDLPIDPDAPRAINLEVITTNLNHLSPYTIPFKGHLFYFDPDEWSLLFPEPVVTWMKNHPRRAANRAVVSDNGKKLLPLPESSNLPVVVAARLSLSFPGLVCAVPLYAVDFSLKRNQDPAAATLQADRCWFSDGGICSNFPVHFFDSPIPKWPTFAINLKEPHPDHTSPDEMVWLPASNGEGALASVLRFRETKPLPQLGEFVNAILSTMEDWRDNLQTRMPGYRNRIVHISLNKDEGGLNLTMPPELIKELTRRGDVAGTKLREDFRWPQHVWARYRTTMCTLERYLAALAQSYEYEFPEDPRIKEWLKGTAAEPTPGYAWKSESQKRFAADETSRLSALTDDWEQKGSFCDGAPQPEPDLRAQPKF